MMENSWKIWLNKYGDCDIGACHQAVASAYFREVLYLQYGWEEKSIDRFGWQKWDCWLKKSADRICWQKRKLLSREICWQNLPTKSKTADNRNLLTKDKSADDKNLLTKFLLTKKNLLMMEKPCRLDQHNC
jgi:hypothetical protein